MIWGVIDTGGRPARVIHSGGQVLGSSVVAGARTAAWPASGSLAKTQLDFWVEAWQSIGGQPAGSLAALRLLIEQLAELRLNSDLQPLLLQFAATAQPNPVYPSRADASDGWYSIDVLAVDLETYNGKGACQATATLTKIAPAAPASLALWWSGALLSTTYTGGTPPAGIVLGAYPVGSTAPAVGNVFSRTGAEGIVPMSGNIPVSTPDPLPFVRPATTAGLYTGGCRILDTVVAGGNAVPTGGTYLHPSWVQVYGTQHDFQGDCVVTNGLLLLLFQVGQQGAQVWLWNTQLGTPAWQQRSTVRYLDAVPNAGILREVSLEKVGLEQARLRANFATSGGQWAQQDWRLARGDYHATFDFWPRTQPNAYSFGIDLLLATAGKIAYNDSAVVDLASTGGASVAPATTFGHATVFGTTANGALDGLLYQNPPSSVQPALSSTTEIGFGDASGPAQGSFRTYGVFAVPFPNAPGLQAEGESGTLPAGWTSGGNVNASGSNEAKCASGTLANVANTFGSWTVPTGLTGAAVDVWFRLRVTSAVGSALEMTCGLWDSTAAAFVASGSTTLNRTAIPTGYGTTNWVKVNTGFMPLPFAGHVLQFRAVTALTLGTDWFVDEAIITPRTSAVAGNIGSGDWPADIWAQFMFPLTTEWVAG